jgi:hypothetical protein
MAGFESSALSPLVINDMLTWPCFRLSVSISNRIRVALATGLRVCRPVRGETLVGLFAILGIAMRLTI